MQINKIISVFITVILFAGFATFEISRKFEVPVLEIISPIEIRTKNDTICIPNVEVFTSDLNKNQSELEKKYKIDHETAIKLGFLTNAFADNFLSDKRVRVKFTGDKNQNCKFAEIYVNKQSYSEQLKKSGFELTGDFSKQLEKAKKLNLVILNHKSNKYHKLSCKYGILSHDNVILKEQQLPKNAKPCKFCHVDQKTFAKRKTDITYPLVISDGNVKMYLTDMTLKLKPDNKCTTLVCQSLLNQINSSKYSIDIALYGWDNVPEIYNALLKAKSRGVKIRIVYDTNSYYPDTKTLIALAEASSTDTPKILMHNKFMIFDNKSVITGSMNFAKTGLSGFNSNCVLFINSKEIAQIFQEEFEQMLNGKFHSNKQKINHKTVILGNTKITPLFSPQDKIITSKIIPLINNAKSYIYIPTFIITHDELSKALTNAKSRGVDVKIIVDAASVTSQRSKVSILRQVGIPVKVENYAGKLHSKSIIIDDKYVITGSMNFSNSGENKNDENSLIIESERFAKYYREFFEYLWKKIPDKYLKLYIRAEGKDSIGSCSDGIDNNFDGKIDMNDNGCK